MIATPRIRRFRDRFARVELHAKLVQVRAAEHGLDRTAHLLPVRRSRVRPLHQAEIADAEIAPSVLSAAILEAERAVRREPVVQARRHVGLLERPPHLVRKPALGRERDDRPGIEGPVPVHVEAQRRAVLHERPAHAHVETPELLGRFRARKRVPGVEDVGAQAKVRVAAPRGQAGPRDDLDLDAPGVVIVRGKRVGPEAHLADVIAIRQAPAAEAIDLEHRSRAPRHRLELGGELVGIVGQARDVLFLEYGAHRVAAPIVGGRRVGDDHLLLETRKAERHRLVVGAAAERHGALVRHEAGEVNVHLDLADSQPRNRDDAASVRR